MGTAKKQRKYLNEFIKLRNRPLDYMFFGVNQTIIVFKYKSLMIISIRVDEYCLK